MRITPETTREEMRLRVPGWASRRASPQIPEASFQKAVTDAALALGWSVWHDHDSRMNEPDMPDLELLRDRLIKVEVKRAAGVPTPGQERYLRRLARAGVETYLWRPSDWPEIVGVLKRPEAKQRRFFL